MSEYIIRNRPNEARPREKLQTSGVTSLSNEELIQLVLGNGHARNSLQSLATSVRERINDSQCDISDLLSVPGLGLAKACRVLAGIELGRRQCSPIRTCIRSAEDVLSFAAKYAQKPQEHLICLNLDGANAVIAETIISIGLLDSTLVHPREVFAEAIRNRAAAVVLFHNHPSGIATPSTADQESTRRLRSAGELLGISLLDHIIVTSSAYYSFAEQCGW